MRDIFLKLYLKNETLPREKRFIEMGHSWQRLKNTVTELNEKE